MREDRQEYAEEARNNVLATNPQLRLPRGWDERMSQGGHRYFVNIYTKRTRWEYPSLPKGWTEIISDSGRPYYKAYGSRGDAVQQWEWPEKEYKDDDADTEEGTVALAKADEGNDTNAEAQIEKRDARIEKLENKLDNFR